MHVYIADYVPSGKRKQEHKDERHLDFQAPVPWR
jgi:hypothetical protein